MSASDIASERIVNNCETCEQIKNNHHHQSEEEDKSSIYSSDRENVATSSCSDSLSKETDLESLKLNFDESKLAKSRATCRRTVTQQNKTFSSEKIREIERNNAMLVDKILYHDRRPNRYRSTAVSCPKITSSEINRRRHQERISRENEILLKKIQSVKPAVRYT